MLYKNTSVTVKTFYGIEFKPGDVHDVPGYINSPNMIRVTEQPKEPPKANNVSKSPSKSVQTKKVEQSEQIESNILENKEENPNGKHNNQ